MSKQDTHAGTIDEEIRKAERITDALDPAKTARASREDVVDLIESVESTVRSLSTDHALAEVFGLAGLHPNPYVRHGMLRLASEHVDNVFARNLITSLTHDDEDFVAFEAIDVCGELELQESLDDLVGITGSPSQVLQQVTKPVGVGRAKTVDAIMKVLGTDDPEEVAELEDHFNEHRHLPLDRLSKPSLAFDESDETVGPDDAPEDMVFVPGGTYTMGIEQERLPFDRVDDIADFTQPYEVELGPFYVDKYPVTNAEYDEFLEFVEEHGHKYCHPGEIPEKDHQPNVRHDDRFAPDHPVTGIDWFDAYAYAKWVGKDLPTEEEWEAAARGTASHLYPWGDEWEPDRLNWAGTVYDTDFETLDEWTEKLSSASHFDYDYPEHTTTPVDAHPEGASEFGAEDMVGNLWEYTKTNFFTRQEICPLVSHPSRTSHENLMKDPRVHPVIRGGAWSSIPEMTTTVYRTKDLMTDRHYEIGFRCIERPGR